MLGIGFSKSGTTSLWGYLAKHPQRAVAIAEPGQSDKAIRFFSNDTMYARGMEVYESFIHANTQPGQFALDVCGEYAVNLDVLKRIQLVYPSQDLKLLFSLRDPVERLFSDWNMMMGRRLVAQKKHEKIDDVLAASTDFAGFEDMALTAMKEFEQCFSATQSTTETMSLCFRGKAYRLTISMYDIALETWMHAFPHEQFCLVHSDFLFRNSTVAMGVVSDFIGLEPFDWGQFDIHANQGGYSKRNPDALKDVDPMVIAQLREFFARHGTKYYDLVSQHGYHGCRPASTSWDSWH